MSTQTEDSHLGSGCGIMQNNSTKSEGSQRLPDEFTVFQAEIMAIRIAKLDLASQLTQQDRYINYFSDSRAAIQALSSSTVI